MKKTLFGLFFLMVLTASLHAQREAPMVMDYVYMKDGSILIGKVTFDTEQYTLTLEDGQQLQLEKSEVKKIIQKVVGDNRSNSLSLENKRKFGLVHQFGLTVITPSSQATYNNFYFTDYSSGGFQLDYALHKYINQYFSAGIKLGIQKAFILDQNELKINVPVAVSMTNYFFTGFPSFFIDNTLGYNHFKYGNINEYGLSKGGFYYTPSIGLRIPTIAGFNIHIGVGANFQKIEQKFSNEWNSSHKKLELRRYIFSAAIQF